MVIVAHPDDAEFIAGGTVAAWVKDGWDVYYVLCTDGGGGGSDEAQDVNIDARKQIVDMRQKEQLAAAEILGIKKVTFLGHPDSRLELLRLREDLVREMRRYRPSRIICPSPDRVWRPVLSIGAYHVDHRMVGEATLDAV